MSIFQNNPSEFIRVVGLLKGMTPVEARRFLSLRVPEGYYARLIAPALGIATERKYLTALSTEVYNHVKANNPQRPVAPPVVRPPAGGGAICTGCGGVGDTPKFLRWAKVARGEAVTISVDETDKPDTLHWLTAADILKEWFEPWSVDTSIRFALLDSGKGDIHIRFAEIDGPGKTQGFAWLPAQSVDFMELGGDLSGDMVIDKDERWTSPEEIHETGEHEGGHSIGIPHTNAPADVMYPYTRGFRRKHSVNDKRAKTLRYPPLPQVIAA